MLNNAMINYWRKQTK